MKNCTVPRCSKERYVMAKGKVNPRCSLHLTIFNKMRRIWKAERSEAVKTKNRVAKAESRTRKRQELQLIDDQSIQRVAMELSAIKESRTNPPLPYVIVRDVINDLSANSLKLKKSEPITFGTENR